MRFAITGARVFDGNPDGVQLRIRPPLEWLDGVRRRKQHGRAIRHGQNYLLFIWKSSCSMSLAVEMTCDEAW